MRCLSLLLLILSLPALAADPPADSMRGKIFVGYQGWHAAPAVEGTNLRWVHYGHQGKFDADHRVVDLWPDVADLPEADRVPTEFKFPDGRPAPVFSAASAATVDKHFEWMKQYGIDGAFLQRFAASAGDRNVSIHINRVLENVRKSSAAHGRSYAVMYDLSGLRKGRIGTSLVEDWKRLAGALKVRDDKSYLRHNGKPVVSVWGIGFNDNRDYTLAECLEFVRFLKSDPAVGGNAVMIGVPFYWRRGDRDAVKDPVLLQIIAEADIVSPWSVGRYNKPEALPKIATEVYETDLKALRDLPRVVVDQRPVEMLAPAYLPVIFPGFSWHNLQKTRGKDAPLDAIPRRGGQFLWAQAIAARRAGAEMLYIAMFDEIDEGTAIFKVSPTPPAGFLPLDAARSDHYLWLSGEIGRMLRGEIPAADVMPNR